MVMSDDVMFDEYASIGMCCQAALLSNATADAGCEQYTPPNKTLHLFELFNATSTQQEALYRACHYYWEYDSTWR